MKQPDAKRLAIEREDQVAQPQQAIGLGLPATEQLLDQVALVRGKAEAAARPSRDPQPQQLRRLLLLRLRLLLLLLRRRRLLLLLRRRRLRLRLWLRLRLRLRSRPPVICRPNSSSIR